MKRETPWRRTCRLVREYIDRNPAGVPIKDLVESIDHHYADDSVARACIIKYIEDGLIPELGVVREDGKVRIYPA
jgi:hypothetical protein